MQRRSSTEAANKKVAYELKRCDKRKRARSEYHHYTALYKALTLTDVKLPAITKTSNILVANISGFTVTIVPFSEECGCSLGECAVGD